GILVTAGAVAMLQSSGNAAAAPVSPVTASKSDTAQLSSVDGIDWWIEFQNSSQTAQTIQFSDTYQPGSSGSAITDAAPIGTSPVNCVMTSTQYNCDLTIPAGGTVFIAVHMSPATPQCQPQTVSNTLVATLLGQPLTGSPDNNNVYIFPGTPG